VSKLVIGYTNAVVLGTVAASSSVGGLGPDQLQNDQGNSASALQIPTTSGTITVTWTGLYHGFGLFRTNLTASAVVNWTVKSGSTTVYSGTSLAVVPGYRQTALVLSAPVSGTSLVITISDATNPDGYLNIPLAYAGPLFQPYRNMSYQSSPGRMDQTTVATTRSGGEVIRSDYIRRTYDLSFAGIKDVEQTAMWAIDLAGRQGSNLFFVPDPASLIINTQAIFGRLLPQSGLTYPERSPDVRGYRATITERL
jgi:hypothetical protein